MSQVGDALEYIIGELKAARLQRGLSQRALSALTGVPQAHISKIENGTVDLQLSSLLQLARSLGLEPMLVPRALVPAVQTITGSKKASATTPAYVLDDEDANA
jgi:HTH-type transcriptional regulator / antitoxin HipB